MLAGTVQSSPLSDPYESSRKKTESQGNQALTEDEKKQLQELKRRDQEVKAHEAAHVAAGGSFVRGGASFSYQSGPDGRRYAVGGEVSIDVSAVSGDPQATITKMEIVKRAALAPAEPSGQDRAVASQASAMEAEARKNRFKVNNSGGEEGASSTISLDSKKITENDVKKRSASGNYKADARFHPDDRSNYLKIYG